MAELKTQANDASVEAFIDSLDDPQQIADSLKLIEIMSKVAGAKPVMWGNAIVGFGLVHLKYASGRDLEWLKIGFSPRKGKLSLYVTFDADKLTAQFKNLGKYKTGKGCIYINRLADVDEAELTKLIKTAYEQGANTEG